MNNRLILHIDMNSYFATMEQQAYPNLRGKPIGVAGKGRGERTVVAGASMEAKKFGITSGMSTWEATRLCPQLLLVPANYDRYIFTSQRIFSLLERFSPTVDIFSIDEAFVDLTTKASWDDAVTIAQQMKQLIHRQIGSWVTCSIGISYGKTLAKLASEMQKPDGLTLIKPADFARIAAVTPIEDLCGIGWAIRPRLNQMGVFTIAELANLPKSTLVTSFGDFTGSWLYNISHGIDDNHLRSFRRLDQEKSIGHSYTLPKDVASLDDVKKVMLLLAERVGVRLRHKNLIGKTVSVYVRFADKSGWGQRATQKDYLLDGYTIYQAGARLLDLIPNPRPVRLIAITISDLVQQVQVTQPLFPDRRRWESLTRAIDRINQRDGEFTVYRATLNKIKSRIFNLPDGRNKRTYLPQINHINPFTKRVL